MYKETQNVFKYKINVRDTKCIQIYKECKRHKLYSNI